MKRTIVLIVVMCIFSIFLTDASAAADLDTIFKSSVNPKLNFMQLMDLGIKDAFMDNPVVFAETLSKYGAGIRDKVCFLLVWTCKNEQGGIDKLTKEIETLKTTAPNSSAIVKIIEQKIEAKVPDYREIFTRETDGWASEALGLELRQAFERNPTEFIQRLSVYKVKWQLQTVSLLVGEYNISEELDKLGVYILELKKQKQSYLFEITADNLNNKYLERITGR